jgi:hypothetical protein
MSALISGQATFVGTQNAVVRIRGGYTWQLCQIIHDYSCNGFDRILMPLRRRGPVTVGKVFRLHNDLARVPLEGVHGVQFALMDGLRLPIKKARCIGTNSIR